MLAETPIAAAASISPKPNTTGKSGNMSIRDEARFMIHTDAANSRTIETFGILANSLPAINVQKMLIGELIAVE